MKEKINVELFFLRIKNTFLYTTVTPLYIFVSLWWLFFKNEKSQFSLSKSIEYI